jgi:L-serine dehydratase
MTVSVFDLFSVGIGPSSSHTVGPMRAAGRFVADLDLLGFVDSTTQVIVQLYGSLAATGRGHGTLGAVLLGLEGRRPETITSAELEERLQTIRADGKVLLGGRQPIPLCEDGVELHASTSLPPHPNGMRLTACDHGGRVLHGQTYFSVGGGFVLTGNELAADTGHDHPSGPFATAAELLNLCTASSKPISQVMMEFEATRHTPSEVVERLLHVRDVMWECAERGIATSGQLPGGLQVRRRAAPWYDRLRQEDPNRDPALAEDWVNLVALAVNEENAAGGRVVTAPTNGAAGVIPAVLHYATRYTDRGAADPDVVAVDFLLTAGAIGSLYKERASISGAEVGCQGEVGSASSMAAAGLAEILGGTPSQVQNAAEIAMEHSLGMTCDPVAGLVQIPCIERNAIAAGKAVNAARMAMRGDGTHRVSLDEVITTMRNTGRDMSAHYKETSTGGLALTVVPVNVVEC